MTPNRAEVQAVKIAEAADRLRAFMAHPSYPHTGRHYTAFQEESDKCTLASAYLAQDPSYADLTAKLAAAEAQLAEERAKVAELEAERDRLNEKSESASALCLAWDFVFQGITAHIRDRIAVGDPASPETYLQIIQEEAGQVAVDSRRFLVSRRDEIERLHAKISELTNDNYDDPTPLTPEVVMELLPANVDPSNVYPQGIYRTRSGEPAVEWRQEGDEFYLYIGDNFASLEDIGTIGNFRHLLAALRIGGAA